MIYCWQSYYKGGSIVQLGFLLKKQRLCSKACYLDKGRSHLLYRATGQSPVVLNSGPFLHTANKQLKSLLNQSTISFFIILYCPSDNNGAIRTDNTDACKHWSGLLQPATSSQIPPQLVDGDLKQQANRYQLKNTYAG